MEFAELVEYRKSVRAFKPDAIEQDKLERVMNAARLAPSAANVQPWKFILVKDDAMKRAMVDLCWKQRFVAEAPLVIVACALPARTRIGGAPSAMVDAAIAVTHLILAAAAEKLGTCWIGAFESQPLKELLTIPDDVSIAAVLPIGYPVDDSRVAKSRKAFDQIICEETWA